MPSPNTHPSPQPRRSFRVSLEVALAGLIALALIVAILAGVFSLGGRRLGDVQTAAPAGVSPPHMARGTPGLQAPTPLPQARVRAIDPVPMAAQPPADAVAPDPSQNQAFVPPAAVPFAPASPVAPVQAPAASLHADRPQSSLGDYLGFLQFTKIRDAYLNRPDPIVNHTNVERQRPQATIDLSQARSQGSLTPQAVRELAARRQAMQSLSDLRSQARMDRNRLAPPATRPSIQ